MSTKEPKCCMHKQAAWLDAFFSHKSYISNSCPASNCVLLLVQLLLSARRDGKYLLAAAVQLQNIFRESSTSRAGERASYLQAGRNRRFLLLLKHTTLR